MGPVDIVSGCYIYFTFMVDIVSDNGHRQEYMKIILHLFEVSHLSMYFTHPLYMDGITSTYTYCSSSITIRKYLYYIY